VRRKNTGSLGIRFLAFTKFIQQENPYLLIIDEILISVPDRVLKENELISFIDQNQEHLELKLT
jgi:ATP:corrinoid adenosyltransferase